MVFARIQTIAPDLALPLYKVVFLHDLGTAPREECDQGCRQNSKNGHSSPSA